jgi:hypothetical protein
VTDHGKQLDEWENDILSGMGGAAYRGAGMAVISIARELLEENRRLKDLLMSHSEAMTNIYYFAKGQMDAMEGAGGSKKVCG